MSGGEAERKMPERFAKGNVVVLSKRDGGPTSNIVRITDTFGSGVYWGERVYAHLEDRRLQGEFSFLDVEVKDHYLGAI